jgi:hypothetical protein
MISSPFTQYKQVSKLKLVNYQICASALDLQAATSSRPWGRNCWPLAPVLRLRAVQQLPLRRPYVNLCFPTNRELAIELLCSAAPLPIPPGEGQHLAILNAP